ncbi:(S)-benzoin forming benzil reductase [Oceanobacillus halotolerans]|uniref:(S)-benzoin forming benzil reductase n=1 Tax=Oceanobacillus halotolerans TaxID=2663380 RepID=UPI0013DA90B9|nr:(S)-benzoin forming benzil reductase [Oceanobacillus halotolerans]
MKVAIVTGVSKGLGESLARLFIESGIHVIGVSRSKNEELASIAEKNQVTFKHYSCDLGDLNSVENTFQEISDHLFSKQIHTVYLVNNAAVLDPIDQAMNIKGDALSYHVQVNTVAPMVITNLLLRKATDNKVPLMVANVSSGAGERPVYGWSAYCSTKASINMYTKTIALEQSELDTANKIIAFSPGVMDTGMQEKIRSSSQESFMEVDKFREYKEKNILKDTDTVGGVLIDILTDESNLESGTIYNVQDYL